MRKVFIILLLSCLGCGENKKNQEETKEIPDKNPAETFTKEEVPEKSVICYMSTGNDIQRENKTLRDSTILNLELTGEVVTGTFNWIPAEKDSRRGVIQATKTGDEVKGNYSFVQEGVQDTIFIEIQLQETSALVTMLSEEGQETSLEVERVDCGKD